MSMGENAMKTAPKQREWGDTVHKFTLAREPSFPHRLKQDGAEMQGREGVRQLENEGEGRGSGGTPGPTCDKAVPKLFHAVLAKGDCCSDASAAIPVAWMVSWSWLLAIGACFSKSTETSLFDAWGARPKNCTDRDTVQNRLSSQHSGGRLDQAARLRRTGNFSLLMPIASSHRSNCFPAQPPFHFAFQPLRTCRLPGSFSGIGRG